MPAKSTLWVQEQRQILLERFGACCTNCGGNYQLEFAHLEPTDITGLGRGSYQRVIDVKRNPDAYTLLCQPCHKEKDGPLWRNRSDEYRREKRRRKNAARSGKDSKRRTRD